MKKRVDLSVRERANNILFLYHHPDQAAPFDLAAFPLDGEDCTPRQWDCFRGLVSLAFLVGVILGGAWFISFFT